MTAPPTTQVSDAVRQDESPLAHRDFRVYWIGQFVSLCGMWMQMMAQGWVVTRMTGSSAVLGQLNLVQSVPMALLSMRAGVLADRHDRRVILIVTQVVLAILAGGVAALLYADALTLGHIYVYACVAGIVVAFDFPAQQALVPQLVPPRLIPKAIGFNQAIFHGSRFVGPALAGVLVASLGEGSPFVANAVSYLAVIYSLTLIKPRPPGEGAPKPGRGAMGEGLRYVRGEPIVRTLVMLTGLVTVFLMPVFAVFMPMIATKMFHAREWQMGMVMAASGLGAVTGSVLMMRVAPARRGRTLLAMVGVASVMTVVLSRMTSPYAAAAVIIVLNGASSLGLGLAATIIQVVVPDRLRGRVMGIYGLTFMALMPPFALLWGYVADWTSLATLVLGLGVGYGVLGAALLLATGVHRLGEGPAAGAAA